MAISLPLFDLEMTTQVVSEDDHSLDDQAEATTMNDSFENPQQPMDVWVPRDTMFYIIHYTALCSLGISILASTGTLIYQQKSTSAKYFWKRKLGERLVVYLALTDLVYSVSHSCDHILSLVYTGMPPAIPCIIFAFSLLEMILAQSMVVFMTAMSLCLLVSCNRKVSFGLYDLGLLIISYGVPALFCIIFAAYGFLGSSGYWCLTDNMKEKSIILHQILGAIQVLIAALIIFCYSFVWITISNSARRLKHFVVESTKNISFSQETLSTTQVGSLTASTSDTSAVKSSEVENKDKPDGNGQVETKLWTTETAVENPKQNSEMEADHDARPSKTKAESEKRDKRERNGKFQSDSKSMKIIPDESTKNAIKRNRSYRNTAKILSLFVLSYIAQWWPMISVPIWNIFESPPLSYYPVCLFFLNLGGVFNLWAYTVARRLYAKTPGMSA